jgi:hypothetical protein
VYGRVERQLVEKIMNILNPSKTIQQQVRNLMEESDAPSKLTFKAYNSSNYERILADETNASLIRLFCSNILPAIFQLSEYRRAILRHYEFTPEAAAFEARNIMMRQDLLWEPKRRFRIVLHQAVLYHMPASRLLQRQQLDRLERLADLENVQLGIVATETGMTVHEHSNFVLYDERIVKQSILGGEVESDDRQLIYEFGEVFARLEERAAYGEDCRDLVRQAINYFS